jgi:hypothetical protein
VHREVRVEVEQRARGGAGAEAEDRDGRTREERRERGEGVEVGGGERRLVGAAREGEGVDVARAVQEEEASAGERVARGARGDVGDADVVVRGADVRYQLELVRERVDARGSRGGGGGVAALKAEAEAARQWIRRQQRYHRHGDLFHLLATRRIYRRIFIF